MALGSRTATGKTRDVISAGKQVEKWRAAERVDDTIEERLSADHMTARGAIRLHELQQRGINLTNTQQFCLINGQAGTGKTEVVSRAFKELVARAGFCDLKEHLSIGRNSGTVVPAIACLAFQNKVVRNFYGRLDEDFWPNCMTIHKFLGYAPEYEDVEEGGQKFIFEPRYTASNQHKFKVLIIDELGTVPEPLWDNLLAATPADVQIIGMGDINQLAPIGGRPVLPFAAVNWPTVTLTHIYRQSEGGIIDNAARLLKGEPLIPSHDFRMGPGSIADAIKNKDLDLHRDCVLSSDEDTAGKEVSLYLMAAMHRGEYDPDVDMVMTYRNDGSLGRIPLNDNIRFFANGRFSPDPEKAKRKPMNIQIGKDMMSYSVGDRVVSISGMGTIDGMPSGTAGIVTAIQPNEEFDSGGMTDDQAAELAAMFDGDLSAGSSLNFFDEDYDEDVEDVTLQRQSSHILRVYCPDIDKHVRIKTRGEFSALALNWAGTVHRNQGLQHRRVFMIVHSAHMQWYTREWGYTGITRAEETCTLLYRPVAVEAMRAKRFYTGETAHDKAVNYLAAQKKGVEDMWMPEPKLLTAA